MSNCNCGNISLPNGSNGLNGYNAFTVTTASFTCPAALASVTIAVSASGQYTGIWAVAGQVIYIATAGYFSVTSSTQTAMVVVNLGYTGNATSGTIASGVKVSPAGLVGTTGASGSNGTNGTTILYNDPTDTATTAAASPQNLKSWAFAANTLATANNYIEVVAYIEETLTSAVTGNPYYTAILYLGSQIIGQSTWAIGNSTKQIRFNAKVNRLTANTQRVYFEKVVHDYQPLITLTSPGNIFVHQGKAAITADLTASNNIVVTVSKSTGTFAASEITCTGITVLHYKQ